MGISADELVSRNARFAAGGSFAGLSFPSSQTLRVIGCVDSRVDRAHMVILHHTQCGITALAAYPEMLAQ